MTPTIRVLMAVAVCASACTSSVRPSIGPRATPKPAAAPTAVEALARAPLAFEPQAAEPGVYVCRTPAYTLRVSPTSADIHPARATRADRFRIRLLDANPSAPAVAGPALPGTVSYLVGNDPTQWRTAIPTHARVRYSSLYPGIDIVYYGSQREIEYDFIVAPGARPEQIALGLDGLDRLSLHDNGDLALTRDDATLLLRAPRAYQTIDGREVPVAARYRIDRASDASDATHARDGREDSSDGSREASRRVTLRLAEYDRTRPLIIDPILSYATSLGGGGQDEGNAVAVDAAGHVYVAGFTRSTNFPANGTPAGHFDLFLTKLDASGTVLLSSTYIGGSGADETRGLAIDADGHAYLAGVTRSANFPTRNPIQGTLQGESDAFVLKIATNGAGLVFSTYLGGTGLDEGAGVGIDAARNVYVAGTTRSSDFPTASPHQAALAGLTDAFAAKINPTGTSLLYSTYLGGNLSDNAHGIAVDDPGHATIVGTTSSTTFPTQAAAQASLAGAFDAFVTRLTPAGTLAFSTYFGGSEIDAAQGVALDTTGNILVTGSTASADFPVANALQPTSGGSLDAFAAGFPWAGGAPFFSTYLGGSGSDRGRAIARDAQNRVYLAGQTFSANFPAVAAVQPAIGGNRDTFVALLPSPYTTLAYSTYLGSSNNDDGLGITVDRHGRAIVTGATMFAWPDLGGESDAFVMRLSSGLGAADTDGDGMPDDWETQYADDLDPAEDSDGDGISNLAEYQANTHPLGYFTQYLAEGSTGVFFDTRLALFNPGTRTAIVLLRFQREGVEAELTRLLSIPPHERRTILADTDIPGLEESAFATVAESDSEIVLDRTMTWDRTAYGSSAETAAASLSKTWYLAEGATHGRFQLYYLLQNPHAQPAHVTIRFLLPNGIPPLDVPFTVPARGRLSIDIDNLETTPGVKPLRETDVSSVIASDLPILAERAMYMTTGGRLFSAGHESMGVTSPAKSWFFAEGSTGSFFDMYLLLANPSTQQAVVTVDFLFLGGGTHTETYEVLPQSRRTIGVDENPVLAQAALSMKVRSNVPIIAERAMWWASPSWYEAHNSAGALVTSPRWAIAEGEIGGTQDTATYVLVANTSPQTAQVKVSAFFEDGGIVAPRTFSIAGNSRWSVDVRSDFLESEGRRFSVLVEAIGDTPAELVVERAMYSSTRQTLWIAGTDALATPLFPPDTVLITENGVFPKRLVVTDGTRVQFVNRDTVRHQINSDEHPDNSDCPAINGVNFIEPGEAKLTNNLVIELGIHACGFHDEMAGTTFNFLNTSMWGTIIIRP